MGDYTEFYKIVEEMEKENKRYRNEIKNIKERCISSLPFKVGDLMVYDGDEVKISSVRFAYDYVSSPQVYFNKRKKNGEWSNKESYYYGDITNIKVIKEA